MTRRLTAHRRRISDAGLTLVEMVVAIGVVMVVLLAAGTVFVATTSAQRVAEGSDRAIQLANDRIEQMRRVPWEDLGFYGADSGYRASCPAADCRRTEVTVTLPGTRKTGSRAPKPTETTTVAAFNNAFTVRTDITWDESDLPGLPVSSREDQWTNTIGDPAKADQPSPPDGIPDYASKRLTVTVSWKTGATTRTVTAASLRAPALSEAIPAGIGDTTPDSCDGGASPFCRLWVTSGTVLGNPVSGTARTITPVTMRAVTTTMASAVTAQWPGGAATALGSTDSGYTWTLTLPINTVLPLGDQAVTFRATIGAATRTKVYTSGAWRSSGSTSTPPATIAPTVGTTFTAGSLLRDPARAAGTTTAITGNETTATSFCVDPTTRRLTDFQALVFNVTAVDAQDAPGIRPEVSFTGSTFATEYGDNPPPATGAPAGSTVTVTLSPTQVTVPTAVRSPYVGSAAGGTVGAYQATPGVAQTFRYAAGFDRGTVFVNPRTYITISMQRPLDGVTVQRTVLIPVVTGC